MRSPIVELFLRLLTDYDRAQGRYSSMNYENVTIISLAYKRHSSQDYDESLKQVSRQLTHDPLQEEFSFPRLIVSLANNRPTRNRRYGSII